MAKHNQTGLQELGGHRWLENIPVAQRIISLLPELKKYLDSVNQSKDQLRSLQNNQNFKVLSEAIKDSLIQGR